MMDVTRIPSPCYVMEEKLLRKNLSLIKQVADQAGVEIILAFKAFAMWKSFPIFREYIRFTTASSEYEARLAYEEFGSRAHAYSPAYTEQNFPSFLKYCSHITFNSLSQFERFYPMAAAASEPISCGLRVNPEYSEVEVELYNHVRPELVSVSWQINCRMSFQRELKDFTVTVIANRAHMNWNVHCSILKKNSHAGSRN